MSCAIAGATGVKEALAFAAEGKVKANIETTTSDAVKTVFEGVRTLEGSGRRWRPVAPDSEEGLHW